MATFPLGLERAGAEINMFERSAASKCLFLELVQRRRCHEGLDPRLREGLLSDDFQPISQHRDALQTLAGLKHAALDVLNAARKSYFFQPTLGEAVAPDGLQTVVQQHGPEILALCEGLVSEPLQTRRCPQVHEPQMLAVLEGLEINFFYARGQYQLFYSGSLEARAPELFQALVEPDGLQPPRFFEGVAVDGLHGLWERVYFSLAPLAEQRRLPVQNGPADQQGPELALV